MTKVWKSRMRACFTFSYVWNDEMTEFLGLTFWIPVLTTHPLESVADIIHLISERSMRLKSVFVPWLWFMMPIIFCCCHQIAKTDDTLTRWAWECVTDAFPSGWSWSPRMITLACSSETLRLLYWMVIQIRDEFLGGRSLAFDVTKPRCISGTTWPSELEEIGGNSCTISKIKSYSHRYCITTKTHRPTAYLLLHDHEKPQWPFRLMRLVVG